MDLFKDVKSQWMQFFNQEIKKDYFISILNYIELNNENISPNTESILKPFKLVDYKDVKVVIIGQDPYVNKNQSTGLSFAVPNHLIKKPPTIKNIFKEIENDTKQKVNFSNSSLNSWSSQGVFLLNSILTTNIGKSLSNKNLYWEYFTDFTVKILNEKKEPVVFVLWGSYAQKKKKLINNKNHYIIESVHPSPLSAYKGFFGSNQFSKINDILNKNGYKPINWHITC